MANKTDHVMNGFLSLNTSEQAEVIKQINVYLKETPSGQKKIQAIFESRAGVALGPLNPGGCPCCGK